MSAKIVWLASYPKSGNTWLRALLSNYLRDEEEPAPFDRFVGGPMASARLCFDQWVGVEAAALPPDVVDRLRPEVYRCLAREADETLFLKVHDCWVRAGDGEPMFPEDVTAGVVYVLRNPLDLVASGAHHWGATLEAAVEHLCAPEKVEPHATVTDQLVVHIGSWSEHVQSWVDESGLNVHVVRYEDLLDDAVEAFGKVVTFSGLDFDRRRVERAVQLSSFTALRRQEDEEGFPERPAAASGPFFRRGQAGAWRDELPAGLADRVRSAFAPTMDRFGYAN